MGSFKLVTMTLGAMFKKPETIQYPTQKRFAPEGLKGHIVNDMPRCILCGICEKRCPTGALTVEKNEGTWTIDRFRCVQCGSCVRECPEHCLSMDPAYTPVALEMSKSTYRKPELNDQEKAAKEEEKAARIKAALEAKAAREKE